MAELRLTAIPTPDSIEGGNEVAVTARRAPGPACAHVIELTDGSTVEGHQLLLAVGRTYPVAGLGLETVGVRLDDGVLHPDEQLRIADGVYVAGDPAGPEMHTHLAVYQGEIAARIALGEDVRPDHSAIPHATYTEPQTAGVGLQLEEARERGLDAFEETTDAWSWLAPDGLSAQRETRLTIGVVVAIPSSPLGGRSSRYLRSCRCLGMRTTHRPRVCLGANVDGRGG